MTVAKSCKEGTATKQRRSGSKGCKFKIWCQEVLFTVESLLKSTLPLVICLHNNNSWVRCIGWLCIFFTIEWCNVSSLNYWSTRVMANFKNAKLLVENFPKLRLNIPAQRSWIISITILSPTLFFLISEGENQRKREKSFFKWNWTVFFLLPQPPSVPVFLLCWCCDYSPRDKNLARPNICEECYSRTPVSNWCERLETALNIDWTDVVCSQ